MNFNFGKEWNELKKINNLTQKERNLIFYAENKASMNHFRLLISELTERRDIQICYVTSVKNDPMLKSKNKNIFSFYIGDGIARTKFFLTLKSKILIMDMPDLETFHIKRSKVYNVHYIYIFHSMYSIHSYLRKGAIDNYDTIFCVGDHHEKEIRATEKAYGLNSKKLIKYGFGRLDTLLDEKQKYQNLKIKNNNLIIICPTYGENNLLKICGEELIQVLLKSNFRVLLRPHFKILSDNKDLIDRIQKNFGDNPNFELEEGVISPDSFHNSKCMISDWSGISLEYAFTFERPVIFIDVPKKILNHNQDEIHLEPLEISIREKIGHVVNPKNIESIPDLLKKITTDNSFEDQIKKIRTETVYNIGKSAELGANFIQEMYDESNQQI